MAVVYNQALANRFGTTLVSLLDSGTWTSFEAAVAWVRRSGTQHILPSLENFLAGGRSSRIVVGCDVDNTSQEGLEDLLSLSSHGNSRVYVYHNESGFIFHPKLYLFSNNRRARVVIGSNNLTESGLFTNTEVALQVDVDATDPLVADVRTALDSWCDVSENLARELTQSLIQDLLNEGYVHPEAQLAHRCGGQSRRQAATAGRTRRQIFGRKTITAPAPPRGHAARAPVAGRTRTATTAQASAQTLTIRGYSHPLPITNVLLMRVRPARGTQVQIPIPLRNSWYFAGLNSITSGHDGATRPISATRPQRGGGAINTIKVEITETRGLTVPVLRLDKSAAGIVYYAYDATSLQGKPIMDALESGRNDNQPTTVLTKPNDPDHSTWYRFI